MSAHTPETYPDFLDRYAPLISDLAAHGWTATETYHRLILLYPQANRDHLNQAIHSGDWTFATNRDHTISTVLMASALWYAVANAYDLQPNPSYAAVTLDPVILQDLPSMLETFDVAPEHTATIVGMVGAALEYLAEHPYTTLEESDYDEFIANLPPEATGLSRDNFNWPPPRGIITDRLGDRSWADALLKVGICPPNHADLGISLDPNSLSETDFRNALSEFLSYCIRHDRKPTVLLYGTWSASHRPASGNTPYLGLVRASYGSWQKALTTGRRMINDALHFQDPVRPRTAEPLTIESVTAQGIGIVQTGAAPVDLWETLHTTMFQRLEELPWSLSLRIYYMESSQQDGENYLNHVRILRSPAGYICELTSPEEFTTTSVTLDTEALISQGWAVPIPGGRWTKTFLSVPEAATGIISAMRDGMGCTRPDYYQSESPNIASQVDLSYPTTGAIPMVSQPAQASTHIDDFH